MITREVLNAKREAYFQERERVSAEICAYNGAIGAIDDLLALLDQADAAQPTEDFSAVMMTAEETKDA